MSDSFFLTDGLSPCDFLNPIMLSCGRDLVWTFLAPHSVWAFLGCCLQILELPSQHLFTLLILTSQVCQGRYEMGNSLFHYGLCPVAWAWLLKPMPVSMGQWQMVLSVTIPPNVGGNLPLTSANRVLWACFCGSAFLWNSRLSSRGSRPVPFMPGSVASHLITFWDTAWC